MSSKYTTSRQSETINILATDVEVYTFNNNKLQPVTDEEKTTLKNTFTYYVHANNKWYCSQESTGNDDITPALPLELYKITTEITDADDLKKKLLDKTIKTNDNPQEIILFSKYIYIYEDNELKLVEEIPTDDKLYYVNQDENWYSSKHVPAPAPAPVSNLNPSKQPRQQKEIVIDSVKLELIIKQMQEQSNFNTEILNLIALILKYIIENGSLNNTVEPLFSGDDKNIIYKRITVCVYYTYIRPYINAINKKIQEHKQNNNPLTEKDYNVVLYNIIKNVLESTNESNTNTTLDNTEMTAYNIKYFEKEFIEPLNNILDQIFVPTTSTDNSSISIEDKKRNIVYFYLLEKMYNANKTLCIDKRFSQQCSELSKLFSENNSTKLTDIISGKNPNYTGKKDHYISLINTNNIDNINRYFNNINVNFFTADRQAGGKRTKKQLRKRVIKKNKKKQSTKTQKKINKPKTKIKHRKK